MPPPLPARWNWPDSSSNFADIMGNCVTATQAIANRDATNTALTRHLEKDDRLLCILFIFFRPRTRRDCAPSRCISYLTLGTRRSQHTPIAFDIDGQPPHVYAACAPRWRHHSILTAEATRDDRAAGRGRDAQGGARLGVPLAALTISGGRGCFTMLGVCGIMLASWLALGRGGISPPRFGRARGQPRRVGS